MKKILSIIVAMLLFTIPNTGHAQNELYIGSMPYEGDYVCISTRTIKVPNLFLRGVYDQNNLITYSSPLLFDLLNDDHAPIKIHDDKNNIITISRDKISIDNNNYSVSENLGVELTTNSDIKLKVVAIKQDQALSALIFENDALSDTFYKLDAQFYSSDYTDNIPVHLHKYVSLNKYDTAYDKEVEIKKDQIDKLQKEWQDTRNK